MTSMKTITVGQVKIGEVQPLAIIAGLCVAESLELVMETARELKRVCDIHGLPLIYKASYDKANRTSIDAYRGPGMKQGLDMLMAVKSELGIPVLTDVHEIGEVAPAAEVVDVIQIPAFLCRQTDLVVAAAKSGRVVNVKKGQFLAPWDMKNVVRKVEAAGGAGLLLTERGASFGYNNLVFDARSIPVMRGLGWPVVFDATHSVQLPGGAGASTGGQREFIEPLSRAAIAAGADALFLEVHPDPDKAKSDGPNSLRLADAGAFLGHMSRLAAFVRKEL